MGKISPVSAKYIIHSFISVEGVVDRPDVIGAVFGQTEGLLGNELELRELQRSGRIGRIEVNLEIKSGKASGMILIPSSLDKAETAIVGASLETIQRIGPCNAKVRTQKIEDVRISKRTYVIERAKELLKTLVDSVLPDSQEIADEVAHSVRMMEIREYGSDRLASGPAIDESEDIIVVEGRADVLNLLKYGIKNAIAMNGTNVPQTIIDLCKKKIVTVFVDGDKGGDLIIREISDVAEIDYVTRAPDGKEVEEITKKEIHKALRARVAVEQVKMDISRSPPRTQEGDFKGHIIPKPISPPKIIATTKPIVNRTGLNKDESDKLKGMLDGLIGTRGAYILDQGGNILGKVPVSELATTVSGLRSGVHTLVFDGSIDRNLVSVAERYGVRCLVGMNSQVKPSEARLEIVTSSDL
ncbi:MAG TPA: DNA primase DnaG [Candidatus Nanoarchaeia archaeon]|nr:DNA primase DnaG [Candidatus Nanoarchaeia archaeon]